MIESKEPTPLGHVTLPEAFCVRAVGLPAS